MGIQGLGGVGKSTLAAYFYHFLESKFKSLNFKAKFWADVSLKPDFTVFAKKIITKFTGKPPQSIDITELINNLLYLLSKRRCLLVVDNLETLLDEQRNWQNKYYQDFFRRWKQQGTNSTLFITTQDKPQLFQGLKHWLYLGGIKIEEGIALLNELVIKGTEAELKAFVEYVDGHPLTIKLVAEFLGEHYDSQLSPVKKSDSTQFKFKLVYNEAQGLHRNKDNACLSWIIQQHLDRLNSEQKQFITNLSVYRLPFNHEAASHMWLEDEVKLTLTSISIKKKLLELCNRSLLVKTQEKFQFKSLVQKYVLEQANDLTNAHQQAIEYYQANFKEPESWKVLEDAREHLEIIAHHCELKQYASANKVLDSYYGFLTRRGYYEVLVEIYEKLVQEWQPNLQPEDRSNYANSLKNLGNAYNLLGEYKLAIYYHQQSLEIARDIGDRNRVASSLSSLGNAYNLLREYKLAIDYYQQLLKIRQKIGNREMIADSLMDLGTAYYCLGEYKLAIDYYQQLLKIRQKIGDRVLEAFSLMDLGDAYYYLEEYRLAIDYYQQSLEIARDIGDRDGEADSLMGLGDTYNNLGEYPQAIDYLQQSLKIKRQIKDRYEKANSLMGLGNVYNNLGEYPRAIDYLQQPLDVIVHSPP